MDDEADEGQNEVEDVDPNTNWGSARYVPAAPGARLISIRMQSSALRQIIRAAIRQVIGDAIFDNAYPAAKGELTYYRKTLRSCARKLKHEDYAERFKTDHHFGVIVARLVCTFLDLCRLSNLQPHSYMDGSQPIVALSRRWP